MEETQDEEFKEDSSDYAVDTTYIAVNPLKGSQEISPTDFHYCRTIHSEKCKATAHEIKMAAKEDFKNLCGLHATELAEFEVEQEGKSGIIQAMTGGIGVFKLGFL